MSADTVATISATLLGPPPGTPWSHPPFTPPSALITKDAVVIHVYESVFGSYPPGHADLGAMYKRLITLVENDEQDVWKPEQEFEVTLTYTVQVTGTVMAIDSDAASDIVWHAAPSLKLQSAGELSDAYVADVTLETIDFD